MSATMGVSATANDIDKAMTLYKSRLTVPSLFNGELEMRTRQTAAGPSQYPFALTGAFARVFSIRDASKVKRAVRCFYNTPKLEYQHRYSTIASFFLQNVPRITADFKFHEKGLRIETKPTEVLMPIIEMEWVEGETLLAHVDRLASKRDTAALGKLAGRWVELIQQMRAVNLAHGDLSGTNVMVRSKDGSLVLIDYDGVYLPAFAGQETDQAGNPPYQHPDMQNRPYNERMDNFSALLIYVALFALSEQPDLWKRYSMHDNAGVLQTEEMLFKTDDLRNPAQSRLFADLSTLTEPNLQKAVAALRDACYGPVDQVPDFIKVVDPHADQKAAFAALEVAIRSRDDREIVRVADNPALTSYGPAQHPQIKSDVQQSRQRVQQADELAGLLAAGDEEAALQVWLKGGFSYTMIARPFTTQMQAVQQRLERLNKLKLALDAKDDEATIAAWDDALFKTYKPALPYAKAVDEARKRMARLKPLLDALQAGDDLAVERLWLDLENYVPARKLAPQVEMVVNRVTQRRAQALQALVTAIANNDDAAIAAAADDRLIDLKLLNSTQRNRVLLGRGRVTQLKEIERLLAAGDDEAVLKRWVANDFNRTDLARSLAPQIKQVEQRVVQLRKLEQALKATDDPEQDRKVVSLWDDNLFRGYARAEVHRAAFEAAQARLARLTPLELAIKQQDDSIALSLWEGLKTYGPAQVFGKSIEQAERRLEQKRKSALKALEQAINLRDDRAILAAANDPALKNLPAMKAYHTHVTQAQARVDALKKLEQMMGDPAQEEQLLQIWKQQGLDKSPLARPLAPRIEHVRRRRQALEQVKRAVDKRSDTMLLTAWDERLFSGYAPAQPFRPHMEKARQSLRSVEMLSSVLASGNDRLAMVLWDDLKVSELPGASTYEKDVRASKLRWLGNHVPTNLQGKLENETLTLTWDWPEGLSSVGITIQLPGPGQSISQPKVAQQPPLTVSLTQYLRNGGYTRHIGKVSEVGVSVFPLVSHGKQLLLDSAIRAAYIRLKPASVVSYGVVRGTDGKNYLEIDASDLPTVPALLIVVSTRHVASNVADGVTIGTVGAGQGVRQSNGTYRVPIDSKGWTSPSYLTLFPANQTDSEWLTLLPKNGKPPQIA